MNKTGIELIAQERKEQITKHGFTSESDQHNDKGELWRGAIFALTGEDYPPKWNEYYRDRILAKDRISQLAVAGALIAAEIDRLMENGG